MTDTIHTVTLTPQEQAAFESGRKIGWNEGIEAAANICEQPGIGWVKAEAIRALSMPTPAQVRVKPLEWKMTYGVDTEYWAGTSGDFFYRAYDEEQKAKAELRHAARILAALIPASEDDGA